MTRWLSLGYSGHALPHLYPFRHWIFYARQYASHAAWPKAETIRLIRDFKTSVTASSAMLARKQLAIRQFAAELIELLTDMPAHHITWIPTSRAKNDPKYDNRFEQVVEIVASAYPDRFVPVECFVKRETHRAIHKEKGQREPAAIAATWQFVEPPSDCRRLLVLDDVLTTGASLRAAFETLHSNAPYVHMMGIVWALTRGDYQSRIREREKRRQA